MQDVQNPGSLLQSYSLKKVIESMGHKVYFIPIEARPEDNELLIDKAIDDFANEYGRNKHIFMGKNIDKYILIRLRNKYAIRKRDKIFDSFRERFLIENHSENGDIFDCCVIGSDEVFNCLSPSPWGFTCQLFGNINQANKVITYAASCGSTKIDNVPHSVKSKIKESLLRVSALSVRDENTRRFIKEIIEINPELNLDPVIVGNFNKEIEECLMPKNIPSRYCIVYSYYNRINNKKEIEAIKIFCKNHNMKIIAIGAPQMWIKNYIVCNPFQILKIFCNADFVITDTFHGTIFSAKYNRKFAILVKESNSNKLYDLVGRLNLEKHLISSMNDLEKTYIINYDKSFIEKVEKNERLRTIKYLSDNLK